MIGACHHKIITERFKWMDFLNMPMTEWTLLIPIIAVLVQGSIAMIIACITWFNQKKTAKDIEEFRHELTKKRFSLRKRLEKAEPVYLDIIKTCSDILACMEKIGRVLSNHGKDLYPLAMLYIYSNISKNLEKSTFLHGATESEKFQIEGLDKFLHLNSLSHSLEELHDMKGLVEFYATSEIKELYTNLCHMVLYFSFSLANEVNSLITQSTMKTDSSAERLALEIFSNNLKLMEKPQVAELQKDFNFELSVKLFSEVLTRITNQMKSDLFITT